MERDAHHLQRQLEERSASTDPGYRAGPAKRCRIGIEQSCPSGSALDKGQAAQLPALASFWSRFGRDRNISLDCNYQYSLISV
jgi:hypothetical protein